MRLEPVAAWLLTRLDTVDMDDDAFRMVKRLRKLLGYQKNTDLEIVSGVEWALRELGVRYRLGLVTTRDAHSTMRFLERYHLVEAFDVIITRDDVKRLKPHPEPIFKAAETLGLASEQCVMVGDTLADVRAARAANAAAVGVLTGFGQKEDMDEADLILDSVVDLVQWL